jgi:hypothetical protein
MVVLVGVDRSMRRGAYSGRGEAGNEILCATLFDGRVFEHLRPTMHRNLVILIFRRSVMNVDP